MLCFGLGCGVLAPRIASADTKSGHELTALPVVGGSSDVGIGGGYLASYAQVDPSVKPYVWRLESAGAITAKFDDGVKLGYFDDYLLFVVPNALRKRFRFEARASYSIEPRLYYYGLGNASSIAPGRSTTDDYYAFERSHGTLTAKMTYVWPSHWLALTGLGFSHSVVSYASNTALARDVSSDDPAVIDILHVNRRENSAEFSVGTGVDTRDNEVSTLRGQLHTVRLDVAPGGTTDFPNAWARLDLDLRGFLPLIPERLTFAARGVFDALAGDPPFSELSRAGDVYAVGGALGVRGVPAGRYQGKVKVFGNFELRSALFDFRAFGNKNIFGLTAFVDTGRVFSDLPSNPELDGKKLGLKYGVGGGVRVKAGSSFVLRGDLAWSPDASPVGAYLLGGELF